MTTWRQGTKVPHHVYRQRGDEPDTRPWPDGDPPVATFVDPDDAQRAVTAVNGSPDSQSSLRSFVSWLLTMDDPKDVIGRERRRSTTRTDILRRATEALAADDAAHLRAEPARDPVILASHADHPLAEQVQAVLDEEGVEGVADVIRRVARGEGT